MKLSNFPNLCYLKDFKREDLELYTREFLPYSDFNYTSLYAWDIDDQIAFSVLNKNLVVRFQDYNSNHLFYSFIGKNEIGETIEKLFADATERGYLTELQLLPEENFTQTKLSELSEKYKIVDDRDNYDYVLSVEGFALLEGSKYHKKRNLAHRFEREFPYCVGKELDFSDERVRLDVEKLFYLWEAQRKKDRVETQNELRALQKIVHSGIEQFGFGIYDGEVLISFTLGDLSFQDFVVIHFEKSDQSYVGLSTFIKHLSSRVLFDKGYQKINYEQDFGFPGLRSSKELLHPVGFLKKYSISKREA